MSAASGAAWKAGEIDCSGSLMVLTLRLVALAFDVADGRVEDASTLTPYQVANRVASPPSLLPFLGYAFFPGSFLAGPFLPFADYSAWVERRGAWAAPRVGGGSGGGDGGGSGAPEAGCARAVASAACRGLVALVVHAAVAPRFPGSVFSDASWVSSHSFFQKIGWMWAMGFAARNKYYFVWLWAEAACDSCGQGWSGWAAASPPPAPAAAADADGAKPAAVSSARHAAPPRGASDAASAASDGATASPPPPPPPLPPPRLRPDWSRARNVDILGVELATSASGLAANWNSRTGQARNLTEQSVKLLTARTFAHSPRPPPALRSQWLRHYSYERLAPPSSGRAPFSALLATQALAALWHGVAPGYGFFFVGSAFMFQASKVVFRAERKLPKRLRRPAAVLHGLLASFHLNYVASAFVAVEMRGCLDAWGSVRHAGTISMVSIVALGAIFGGKGGKKGARKPKAA